MMKEFSKHKNLNYLVREREIGNCSNYSSTCDLKVKNPLCHCISSQEQKYIYGFKPVTQNS